MKIGSFLNPPVNVLLPPTCQGKIREGGGIVSGQGNVREFDNLAGKIDILKIVRENWDLSGKTNCK